MKCIQCTRWTTAADGHRGDLTQPHEKFKREGATNYIVGTLIMYCKVKKGESENTYGGLHGVQGRPRAHTRAAPAYYNRLNPFLF